MNAFGIDNRHRLEGGTFVTNFDPKQAPLYRKAIVVFDHLSRRRFPQFERKTLAVVEAPGGNVGALALFSLHQKADERFDLSDFWLVFDVLQKAEGIA